MNKFLKNVDFYYINLNKDIEKNKNMLKILLENNIINEKRIEAIDGKSQNVCINGLSFSEHGCTLSHLEALKHFCNNSNNEYAIICEDDIDISNICKINFSFYDTLKFYKPEFYCLQLAVTTREDMEIDFSLRPRTFWDFSTAAYIVNKKYARLLIDSYGTVDDIYKNFVSTVHVDPRGGSVHTRPVADELVYSLCKTYVFPIFTIFPTDSSISDDLERSRQVLHSIKLFNDEWSKYDRINIDRFSQ
jgi:hypothetical protein